MAPPIFEIAPYLFTRRDTTSVLEHFGDTGPMDQTYFFSYLYTALPKGRAMLRHPRIQSKLKEFGFVVYGRAHRLPAGSKPVGQDDFEGKTARTEAPTPRSGRRLSEAACDTGLVRPSPPATAGGH